MIYDPVAGEYVLFGGASGGNAVGSTWVFAHGTWKDLSANLTVAPPARWYNSFVWDASDGYGLLFGGRNPSTDLNDTWTFNGTAWTQVVTSVAPPPITTGRTVYDAADGNVWLYGGYSIMPVGPNAYNFTWTYHGGVWTNITANVTGAPADPHQVSYAVYDSLDGDVLMYGGSGTGGANCTQPGNTWTYRNGSYVNLTSGIGTSPPVGAGSRMMADDPAIGGVLLYGGWDGGSCGLSNETWVYHAGSWSPEALPWNPGPLWDGEMAGGGPAGSVLLFSGNTVIGTSYQSDQTWNFTPALGVSISGGLTGDAPLTVHLSAVTSGVGPFLYNWNWGDGGANNSSANATHTYVGPGTYPISLQVHDRFGKVADADASARSLPPLGAQAHALPSVGVAPLHVSFQATGSGGLTPYRFTWTFGVGTSTATGPSTSFDYSQPGVFSPTLTVTDNDSHQFVSQLAVTVVAALNVSLSAPSTIVVSGTPATFVATPTDGLGPYTYDWNFGDGSQLSAAANVSHTYAGSGTYPVSVAVTDQLGETVTRTADVPVVEPLTVALVAKESSIPLGQAVQLRAEVAGGATPLTESWSGMPTGCPSSPTGFNVTCTPSATGTFHVTVRVVDAAGESRSANATVVVSVPTAPAGGGFSATSWLELGSVVAVLAAALLVSVVVWRRRARPPG